MGDQYYPRYVRKIIQNMGLTKVNFFTFRRFSPESQTSCTNISANSQKNLKVFLDLIRGLWGVDSWKYSWPKISCYSPFYCRIHLWRNIPTVELSIYYRGLICRSENHPAPHPPKMIRYLLSSRDIGIILVFTPQHPFFLYTTAKNNWKSGHFFWEDAFVNTYIPDTGSIVAP
jgi:hypothetical protein